MWKEPHIVVVGSANIDLTILTDAMPRPGETIFGHGFQLGFGGKGANQAVAAKLCGARVSMVARVGDDLFGPATIRNFQERGIESGRVLVTKGVASGVAPIFVDNGGQNRIIVVKGANDQLSPADIDQAAGTLRKADCIVLQLEIPLETVYHTLRFAREHGIRTILNPAPGQPLSLAELANADYVIPNEIEAEALGGMPVHNEPEALTCAESLRALGLRGVIVTLGEGGVVCAGVEGVRHIAAHGVTPVDTTGAGDAFIGSFAAFLSGGYSEKESIQRANVYAALSTLGAGTQRSFPTLEQFEEVWTRPNQTEP